MATKVLNGKPTKKIVKTRSLPAGVEFVPFTQTLAPDIYQRAEKYGKEFGFSVQDVVRQATAQLLIRTGY